MSYINDIARDIAREAGDSDPDADQQRLFLLYAVLALVKGPSTTRRDVHDAWAAWQAGIDPTHESLVPFDELDVPTRAEDDPYARAIHSVAARLDRWKNNG